MKHVTNAFRETSTFKSPARGVCPQHTHTKICDNSQSIKTIINEHLCGVGIWNNEISTKIENKLTLVVVC